MSPTTRDTSPNAAAAAKTERDVTIINQASLESLAEFARATGWQVMWGLKPGNRNEGRSGLKKLLPWIRRWQELHSSRSQ